MMSVYKKMYCRLFNRITDVIYDKEKSKEEMIEALKQAQLETEEIFMSFEENENSEEN